MADSEEGETIEPRSWRGGGGGRGGKGWECKEREACILRPL